VRIIAKKIWSSIKLFPFASYGTIGLIVSITANFQNDYSSGLMLMIPFLPVFLVCGKICDLMQSCVISSNLDFILMMILTLPFFLFLDLLILYIRKCLIPAIRGKNKKLLIPSFFKVFSKVKRG
jgi:hypothetical protein